MTLNLHIKLTRLLTALSLCISTAACVGAGTYTGTLHVWDVADAGKDGLCPQSEEHRTVGICPRVSPDGLLPGVADVTPDNLIEKWGKPTSDKLSGDFREILYNHSLAWRGVVIFVVIPIPLLVPLGHDQVRFVFKGEALVHVEYTEDTLDAAVCGVHSEGPNGFGCVSHWD